MTVRINPSTNCYKAAVYCRDYQATDEQAAKVFGLKPASVKHTRYQLGIKKPGSTRGDKGSAIQAAKGYLNSELTMKAFAASCGINRGSIQSALNRMGHRITYDKPDRRLMKQHGVYYFRLRKYGLKVFIKLSNDLRTARAMRDKLERKYKV